MKTLALNEGDLVVGSNGHAVVSGPAMIQQDLRCGLLEPLGNDRFHPGYGSRLDEFTGLMIDPDTSFEVRQEVARVVQNYAAIQRDKIERDSLMGARSRFETNEVIGSYQGTTTRQIGDVLYLRVAITTLTGQAVDLVSSVGA